MIIHEESRSGAVRGHRALVTETRSRLARASSVLRGLSSAHCRTSAGGSCNTATWGLEEFKAFGVLQATAGESESDEARSAHPRGSILRHRLFPVLSWGSTHRSTSASPPHLPRSPPLSGPPACDVPLPLQSPPRIHKIGGNRFALERPFFVLATARNCTQRRRKRPPRCVCSCWERPHCQRHVPRGRSSCRRRDSSSSSSSSSEAGDLLVGGGGPGQVNGRTSRGPKGRQGSDRGGVARLGGCCRHS